MSSVAAAGVRTGPPTVRAGNLGISRIIVLQVAVGVIALLAWEVASQAKLINPILLGRPTGIAQRFVEMLAGEQVYSRSIYDHLWATLQVILAGYLIGAVAGIGAGFAFGRLDRLARILEPFVLAVAAIPKIAIAPLFVIVFGIGIASKIAIVFIEVFFMVFFNTMRGVREVNEEYVHIARILGATRLGSLRRIVLPAAMPQIMIGLRMGVPYAMIGAILGEYIASNMGLGWLILYSAASFDANGLWATLVLLVLTTWVLGRLLRLAERRLLGWVPPRTTYTPTAI